MPDNLFNYTFNINNSSSQNEILEAVRKNRFVLPKPESHFFVDLALLPTESEGFGPMGTSNSEREKKFRITSVFNIGAGANKTAYAVTNGLLFICPHGNSTTKVNVFLKPSTGKICDIGVKIKYFVYRGVLKSGLFEELNATTVNTVIRPNNTHSSNFTRRVWDEFLEFNFPENQNAEDHTFLGKQLGFDVISETDPDHLLNLKFNPNKLSNVDTADSLALIKRGEKIGLFQEKIGFEVVLDYGDSELGKSETGFQLDLKYATAEECIFNLNTDPASRNDETKVVGNIPLNNTVSEKIFKENIFHFMDPAVFYGAHVTKIDGDENKGKIYYGPFVEDHTAETKYVSKEEIATNIIAKFTNKNKIFLYILGKRGRSFNFYNPSLALPITLNDQAQSYSTNGWPIKILETTNIEQAVDYAKFNILFNGNNKANDDLLFSKDTNQVNYWNGFKHKKNVPNKVFNFRKPNLNNENIANYAFVNYAGDISEEYYRENLGPVKLDPIFDINASGASSESFLLHGNCIQWLSYLRPKLLTINKDAFLFETKVVYWGFVTVPATPTVAEHKEYRARLYIFSPKEMSQEYINSNMDLKSSAYVSGYGVLNQDNKADKVTPVQPIDEQNLGKLILNDSNVFIWKGIAKDDSTEVTVLALRHVLDGDFAKYHYMIGVTYDDVMAIEFGMPVNSFNKYFKLEEVSLNPGSDPSLKKYKLGIEFDDSSGSMQPYFPSTDVFVYSIDGRFFSTIEYGNEFNTGGFTYHNTIGKSTVEFLPKSNWDGEFGFDYMRKASNSTTEFPAYETITGVNPSQTNPNDSSPTPFNLDLKMYNSLKVNEYNAIPIPWRLASGPSYPNDMDSEYFTPWLSLAKDKTAVLKMRLKVKESGKLFFRFNSTKFDISCAKITGTTSTPCGEILHYSTPFIDSDGVSYDRQFTFHSTLVNSETFREDFEFTITCKTDLKDDTRIDIVSIDESPLGRIYRLAGRLMVYRNEPITLKIHFVPIQIQLPGVATPVCYTIDQLNSNKVLVEKFLLHAGVKADVSINPLVNLIGDPKFQEGGDYLYGFDASQYAIRAGYENLDGSEIDPLLLPPGYQPLKAYLKSKLSEQYPASQIPDSTMIVYFIKKEGGLERGVPQPPSTPPSQINQITMLGGFSNGNNTDAVVFDTIDPTNPNGSVVEATQRVTASHEIYHSLGVPHTFDNTADDSIYLFQGTQTDNIMDYSHTAGKERCSSSHWQWEIIRKNSKLWKRNSME